jgi:hypothetical protein
MKPSFPKTFPVDANLAPSGQWHDAVSRGLGELVANRDFSVSLRVAVREPRGAVDFVSVAAAVERWLGTLDPDIRSGDPTLALEAGPLEIGLRAHGKPEALRGRGRLIENRIPGFANGAITALHRQTPAAAIP